MNIDIFISLVTCVAYIPLLASTVSTWPWSHRHRLFILFLLPAVCYSISDYIFHGNFFPQSSTLLIKISSIILIWAAVQLHCFTSSYFPEDKKRWLIFAYGLLILIIVLILVNYLPESYVTIGEYVYPQFGISIIIIVVPSLILLARNIYIFLPRLKNQENPGIYNQTASLLFSLAVFTISVMIALLPVSREVPLLNVGNLIIAFVLSYAVVGQKIVDIRFVLRRGLIWLVVGIVGIAFYIGLLQGLHTILNIELTAVSMLASTLACILALLSIFRRTGPFCANYGKGFPGRKLLLPSETNRICR